MRITLLTIGSHGDIQPYVALAKTLIANGHEVCIAALASGKDFVEKHCIDFRSLTGDVNEMMRLLVGVGVGPFEYFRGLDSLLTSGKTGFLRDVTAACQDADAIVYSLLGSVAYHVAEQGNIPCFRSFLYPLDPTPDFPALTAPRLPFGGLYNRFTYTVGDLLWSWLTTKHLNAWRQEMGLKLIGPNQFPYRAINGRPIPTLYMFSSHLVPKPKSWKSYHHITGFWCLEDAPYTPEDDLLRFLENGSPPIYIGFGSMVGGSFQEMLDVIVQSLSRTGVRAVLSSGWGNMGNNDLPSSLFKTSFVPHEWLFQNVRAVVHHGGSGTTHTGLRAGLPTLVVPFGVDQPFWGERVYRSGLGPRPIHRNNFTVERFSNAIMELVEDNTIRDTASALGALLRNEKGTSNAVSIIEAHAKNG
jgi:sterol 3beta-glucosyltransferase